MKLVVDKNLRDSGIWGITLISENEEEKYFIKKVIAEGGLHYSSQTSGGLTVGLALPGFSNLRLLTLTKRERIDLAYVMGFTDSKVVTKLSSVRDALFKDPEFVNPPLPSVGKPKTKEKE